MSDLRDELAGAICLLPWATLALLPLLAAAALLALLSPCRHRPCPRPAQCSRPTKTSG